MSNNTSLPKGSIQKARSNLRTRIKREKEEKFRNTYHDKQYHNYYGSKAWKQLREWYINQQPLCENHLRYNIYKSGEEVHHVHFISDGKNQEECYSLLLDPSNLVTLCTDCHKLLHSQARNKGLKELKYVDLDEYKDI